MYDLDKIIKIANEYERLSIIIKESRIKKLPNNKYRILSEKGKNLGTYNSQSKAKKRLKQIEYFKHQDNNSIDNNSKIDLTTADDFSYSAIMRSLRQQATKDQVIDFLKLFKKEFDRAVKNKLQKPEKIGLQNSLIKFNKMYPIKLKKKLVKKAATSELGDPVLVGKYLSDIIKFTLNRISLERRPIALAKLRNKIYHLNEQQLSFKHMPPSSSMGQSITFVKHVLFNHDAQYIREVLNNIAGNLI